MAIEHKWSRTKPAPLDGGTDTVLTITITGEHDIYRLAHHLLKGQVEFSDRARTILGTMKRRNRAAWDYLDRQLGGWRLRGDKEPRRQDTEVC